MRELFNTRVMPGLERNEFTKTLRRSGRPKAENRQSTGTRSEIYDIHDREGKLVAIVHQYTTVTGEVAASGMPDPKYLKIGQFIYNLDPTLDTPGTGSARAPAPASANSAPPPVSAVYPEVGQPDPTENDR